MKWLPLILCVAACADEYAPISSKVTLDDRTWTAGAYLSDVHSPATVTIVLAKELDREICGWTAYNSVEIALLIGDRSEPHSLVPLDLMTPNSGGVTYTDGDLNYHRAVSGYVWPGRTVWEFSEAEQHNVIVQIDGELEVMLPDGRALSAAFSATPCTNRS